MSRPHLNQKLAVGVVFVPSTFMPIMDITIVNVALPTLGRDFDVSPSGVDVVVTEFLVSLAVFIPASGWLGDRFGTKRVLLIAMASFLGTLYMVSLFYQDGLGLSALMSGFSTFPEAMGVMIGAQSAGYLYPRLGPRRLIAGGLLLVALMIGLISLAGFDTSLWYMRGLLLVMGIGIGHVFVPTQAAGFATIPPASMGRASGFFNADRQLGGAVGVAVLTTVIAAVGVVHRVGGSLQPDLGAYHLAFLMAAGVAVIGAMGALWIRDRDAASTMVRPARARSVERQAREIVDLGEPGEKRRLALISD